MTRAEALRRCRVQRMDLPRGAHGFTMELQPGEYLLVLNRHNTAAQDEWTLEHELAHVRAGHFDGTQNIRDAEAEADRIAASALGVGRNTRQFLTDAR